MGNWTDQERAGTWQTDHLLADQGGYFVANTEPGSTSIQLGLSATYSATASAAFVLKNGSTTTANPVSLYPRFLKMTVVTAPTSAVDWRYAIVLDSADRTPTTLAAVASPATLTAYAPAVNNINMGVTSGHTPAGVAYFPLSTSSGGPPTIPAAGASARTIVGNGFIKGSIPVAKDQYTLQFGSADMGGTFQAAAALAKIVEHAPPVVIGPAQCMVIYMWGLSNATAGIAFDGVTLAWVEK